jgi:drug/metabolite transporter (DMT)-like permease
VLVRLIAFVLVFGLVFVLSGRSRRLSRRAFAGTLWMAATLLAGSIGYLASVAFIPVGLAALIFYTFPFYVAALSSLTGREPMTPAKGLALVAAFLGLALALGPSFAGLDWRGVALALLGAAGFGTTIVFGGEVMRENDALTMNVLINLWMMLALAAYVLGAGGMALPTTRLGIVGLGGATLCYLVAFTTWFLGLRVVAPIRAAVMFNIEPLISIAAAWLVLGEHLGPLQLLGVALVVAAIVAMTVGGAPAPR